MVARIAKGGRLHAGYAILYPKIRVPECPFNEPLHRKCNLFLLRVQVIYANHVYLTIIIINGTFQLIICKIIVILLFA